MYRIGKVTLAACAVLLLGSAAHAQVTLNSIRVAAKDTVALAKFYQSAFGMQEVNRIDVPGGPEVFVNFGTTVDAAKANTNSGYTYNITNILSLAAGTNALVTNTAYLRPAAWMSQFVNFYLECRMLTNGVLAQTLTTGPTNYYHFTNTAGSDVAYNVLLNMTGDTWSRTYAVQTIPGQNTFQVDANYEMRRWDDLALAQAPDNIAASGVA